MSNDAIVHLLDDDASVRESLGWLMESNGLSVRAFASPRDFLDSYSPAMAGCLLLDIGMPEMSGLELQQHINELPLAMPIVFVTAHAKIPTCVLAMKAGAFGFCEKPVQGPQLVEIVRQALVADQQRRTDRIKLAEFKTRLEQLTPRERQIMRLLCDGQTMKVTAMKLGISIQTVAKHRTHVLGKTKVSGETELVRLLAFYPDDADGNT